MRERAAAFVAELRTILSDSARVQVGSAELNNVYRDLIRAYAPPNVQFERERIIAQLSNPREIAFVLGLLREGENEAGLLLELIATVCGTDPDAATEHLVDEAWYYLRTSIDATWQIDDAPPNAAAAFAYLIAVLGDRLATLHARPVAASLADDDNPGHAELLRSLRRDLAPPTAV